MNEVEKEFDELLNKLTDEQWWKWVSTWLDAAFVNGMCKAWSPTIKEMQIPKIKKILERK